MKIQEKEAVLLPGPDQCKTGLGWLIGEDSYSTGLEVFCIESEKASNFRLALGCTESHL